MKTESNLRAVKGRDQTCDQEETNLFQEVNLYSLSIVKFEPGVVVKFFAESAITCVWVAKFWSFWNVIRLLVFISELFHELAPEYVPSCFHRDKVRNENIKASDGTRTEKNSGDILVECYRLGDC